MKKLLILFALLTVRVLAQDVVKKAPEVKDGVGPFTQLIIRGVMLIDGTGAPPVGPVDIVVKQNRIISIASIGLPTPGMASDANRPKLEPGGKELICEGMYLMPGFVDMHGHIGGGQAPNAEYVFKLWMAHGITTIREPGSGNGVDWVLDQKNKSATNSITAPRIKASITVRPIEYTVKEKEYILFFEAKKKYFLITNKKTARDFTEKDSIEVDKMSVKERGLVKYVGRNLSDTVMFTLQEKCINFVGSDVVNAKFKKLVQDRQDSFKQLFVSSGTDKQVKITASENRIPYDGFSYFSLSYDGELPKSLRKAYEKMNELNNEVPRKKYLERRTRDSSAVTKKP